jgi:hypothetical protein
LGAADSAGCKMEADRDSEATLAPADLREMAGDDIPFLAHHEPSIAVERPVASGFGAGLFRRVTGAATYAAVDNRSPASGLASACSPACPDRMFPLSCSHASSPAQLSTEYDLAESNCACHRWNRIQLVPTGIQNRAWALLCMHNCPRAIRRSSAARLPVIAGIGSYVWPSVLICAPNRIN